MARGGLPENPGLCPVARPASPRNPGFAQWLGRGALREASSPTGGLGLGKPGIRPLWPRLPPAVVRSAASQTWCRARPSDPPGTHLSLQPKPPPPAAQAPALELQPIDAHRSAGPPGCLVCLPLRIHAPGRPRHICRASRPYRLACSPGFARWRARRCLVLGRAACHDGLSPSRSLAAECAIPAPRLAAARQPRPRLLNSPPAARGVSATCGCNPCHGGSGCVGWGCLQLRCLGVGWDWGWWIVVGAGWGGIGGDWAGLILGCACVAGSEQVGCQRGGSLPPCRRRCCC